MLSLNETLLLILLILPFAGGLLLPVLRLRTKGRCAFVLGLLCIEAALAVYVCTQGNIQLTLFSMTETLTVAFSVDALSRMFMLIAVFAFLVVGVYAFKYMEHEGREDSFFPFYLLVLGALIGMDISKNLITMYLFFELVTLLSMPMVLHERTKESIRAALKYLFYSVAGAFLALLCIFFLSVYSNGLDFAAGGNLNPAKLAGKESLLLTVVFLGIVGFGAKAGMFPLHNWLPTAHPVAPAPASALLSAVITKAGVLAILRIIYYSVGTDFLRGTWVQNAWLGLSLLTVFIGSMMAYREDVFKKRLAYSSVSQISYALCGIFFMTAEGLLGGLLHVIFHASIKICLFLVAGSFIICTGDHCVSQYRGIGKKMPKTLWCFTLASLALIGIPPFSGFISKWYLAGGALGSSIGVFSWLAPVVLLVSALLTAGYLLPITISGFFPGKDFPACERCDEGSAVMWLPIAVLAAFTLFSGIFSGTFAGTFTAVLETLIK